MNGRDVHPNEMPAPHPLDDATVEAFLTGRLDVDGDLGPLAMFAEELGSVISGPAPAPTPALALLFADGFSTAGPATSPAGLPRWRKKMTSVGDLISGLPAKLAGLGLAAKVGLGLGVAAASVTGAGAAGVLPAPVQHAVADAVSTVTPFQFPGSANTHATFGGGIATDATGSGDGTVGVDGQAVAAVAPTQGQGAVSNGSNGAGNGSTGLDRANQTPAAGHVPTSVPAPKGGASGSSGSTGLDRANETPAAGHVPTSVPAGPPTSLPTPSGGAGGATAGSAGSTGLDRASQTPAASHVPATPGAPVVP